MKSTAYALAWCGLVFFCATSAQAQTSSSKYDPARYASEPVWIDMMNDPDANFYETLKAFRAFWEGYQLPEEPEEMEQKGRFKRDIGMKENKPVEKPLGPKPELPKRVYQGQTFDFEVKQFKGWLRNVEPWVQPDGRILSEAERQDIIDRQQRELKAIETKNKH